MARGGKPGAGVSINRFLSVGLALLCGIFAASFFYYMNLSREICETSTRIYGAYLPFVEAMRQEDGRKRELLSALGEILNAADAGGNDALAERLERMRKAPPLNDVRQQRHWEEALDALERLGMSRLRMRQQEEILAGGRNGGGNGNLGPLPGPARLAELRKEGGAALSELVEAQRNMGGGSALPRETYEQLERTATLAHNFENRLLLGFLLLGAGMAGLYALLRRHVVRPLWNILAYLQSLGTGEGERQPPHSDILEIRHIAEALGNLGTYLSKATVRSRKLVSEHDHFQKMSLQDGLTGVRNRRGFDESLYELWHKAREQRVPLALILLDVDKFKIYNDTFGHQEGDECLKRVAAAMARAARATDVCARYGGEEFALLLPGADAVTASAVATRVHAEVALERLPHPASPVGGVVTVSMGVVSMVPGTSQGSDCKLLVRHADVALYDAKSSGRNRSHVYGEEAARPAAE